MIDPGPDDPGHLDEVARASFEAFRGALKTKPIELIRNLLESWDTPVVIANHPSRSAKDVGVYGLYTPREFRDWNDTAPESASPGMSRNWESCSGLTVGSMPAKPISFCGARLT